MRNEYVTAFPGRRDSYQVPLSLFEHGRLVRFVTDGYDAGPVARTLRFCGLRGLERRRCAGLPETLVQPAFDVELGSRMLARVMAPSRSAVIADNWLASRGAAAANARGASVIFYEFQAELGFRLLTGPRQRRILFQFHPHPNWEHPILENDARTYPEFAAALRMSTRADLPPRFAEHTRRAWRAADHVIVASSCTRASLVQAGCLADRISVVPYGAETVEPAEPLAVEPRVDRPYFLWVGAGLVRKGLHHLCRAWKLSGCSRQADLVVVARVVDPGMEAYLAAEGIRWIPGLPRAELNWYFGHAHAFVMPSMSEGFGQVYLEALAHGCPVIGTRHSALPDFARAQPAITYVTPGDCLALADRLREALLRAPRDAAGRAAVAESVREFTWERFRAGIEDVLARFD
jgi:glycosyltransferase involved in cell wall biosynthesis